MLIFAYCIPIIVCLLLKFAFDYNGEWTSYMWTFLFGEATVGGLHLLFYNNRTSKLEYLGSIVTAVKHENEWIELKEQKVQKSDSNGNRYEVTEIKEIRHPETYVYNTSLGKEYKTNSDYYNYVCHQWNQPLSHLLWTGDHIKYGERYGQYKSFSNEIIEGIKDHGKYITVSEENYYTNKVCNSNSIFNFEKISKAEAQQLGLYEWPKPDHLNDVSAILSRHIPIPLEIDKLYRRFNAIEASLNQLRLFILIFEADQGMAVAEKQKSYWKGGNKNEITVCLGVDNNNQVKWVYTFSWAKENIVEVEINQWFLEHSDLDFQAFLAWFSFAHRKWKRREFKDFNYIRVNLQLWQYILIILGGVAMGVISICYMLDH